MSMSDLFPLSGAQWVSKWKEAGPQMYCGYAGGGAGESKDVYLSYWH